MDELYVAKVCLGMWSLTPAVQKKVIFNFHKNFLSNRGNLQTTATPGVELVKCGKLKLVNFLFPEILSVLSPLMTRVGGILIYCLCIKDFYDSAKLWSLIESRLLLAAACFCTEVFLHLML